LRHTIRTSPNGRALERGSMATVQALLDADQQ
jgi:hypothetical protein